MKVVDTIQSRSSLSKNFQQYKKLCGKMLSPVPLPMSPAHTIGVYVARLT